MTWVRDTTALDAAREAAADLHTDDAARLAIELSRGRAWSAAQAAAIVETTTCCATAKGADEPMLLEALELVARTVRQQTERYGRFDADVGGARLAIACLEDEVAETLDAWRAERRRDAWNETTIEAVQVAAVAVRLAIALSLERIPRNLTTRTEGP